MAKPYIWNGKTASGESLKGEGHDDADCKIRAESMGCVEFHAEENPEYTTEDYVQSLSPEVVNQAPSDKITPERTDMQHLAEANAKMFEQLNTLKDALAIAETTIGGLGNDKRALEEKLAAALEALDAEKTALDAEKAATLNTEANTAADLEEKLVTALKVVAGLEERILASTTLVDLQKNALDLAEIKITGLQNAHDSAQKQILEIRIVNDDLQVQLCASGAEVVALKQSLTKVGESELSQALTVAMQDANSLRAQKAELEERFAKIPLAKFQGLAPLIIAWNSEQAAAQGEAYTEPAFVALAREVA